MRVCGAQQQKGRSKRTIAEDAAKDKGNTGKEQFKKFYEQFSKILEDLRGALHDQPDRRVRDTAAARVQRQEAHLLHEGRDRTISRGRREEEVRGAECKIRAAHRFSSWRFTRVVRNDKKGKDKKKKKIKEKYTEEEELNKTKPI